MAKNKYFNKKTVVNGVEFDSKKEARRYAALLILEREGAICNLQRQVKYELIPTQYEIVERYGKDGKRLKDGKIVLERAVSYIADFVYTDNDTGKVVVEDSKGLKTKEYIIKRKLLLERFGIRIREV